MRRGMLGACAVLAPRTENSRSALDDDRGLFNHSCRSLRWIVSLQLKPIYQRFRVQRLTRTMADDSSSVRKRLGQFYTHRSEAESLANWAVRTGMERILEPSALRDNRRPNR